MAWSKEHLEIWAKGAKQKQTQSRRDYRNRQLDREEANALAWRRIDAILGELEQLDRETKGIYRDTYDWEPLSIVNRLLSPKSSGPRSYNNRGYRGDRRGA